MNLKEKIPVLLGVIAFLGLFCGVLYFIENNIDYYYTQIDNTKTEKLNTADEAKYEYNIIYSVTKKMTKVKK